ncbi:zinc-binding protein A33-like [Chaetoceros tenuissimus]|uniref:Zinc-binding protein A33-like n=1 Tax=Chaetoceros tenuissimus TaxID=426638 RepID=A0AAD3D5F8_9STRA|nr:zinc-binding protein A33-like [Chaetoceros tenuissimus]
MKSFQSCSMRDHDDEQGIEEIQASTIARKNQEKFLHEALIDKNWNHVEQFLADETLSKAEKKVIIGKEICSAILYGLPLHLMKGLIETITFESVDELVHAELAGYTLLQVALMKSADPRWFTSYSPLSFEVIELLISIGGKDLVNLPATDKHRNRTSLHMYLGMGGYCSKTINLLLKVGGLDLLDMKDIEGHSFVEFSNKMQRKIIIDHLGKLDPSPRVQNYIESLTNVGVTPQEFFNWIRRSHFGNIRKYLHDIKESREAKIKCITFFSVENALPFQLFCKRHGPIDIAEKIVDIAGDGILRLKDGEGNNCLHCACDPIQESGELIDVNELDEADFKEHRILVEFLLTRGGWKLLLETNNEKQPALHNFMWCNRTNLECIKFAVETGGEELLQYRDDDYEERSGGNTLLHYFSYRDDPDREVILYLVSKAGPEILEIENNDESTPDFLWSKELREYITTKVLTGNLPALSDDLQCPICFDTLFDVHIISKCCHRFCKRCITQSYEKRGNSCPICRIEFSIGDVKKDPLLGKLAIAIKEEHDAKEMLQAQLSDSKKEIDLLKDQLQNALKRKQDEL